MSATAQQLSHDLSVAAYLAGERVSEVKHEYVDGQLYAMAGGSIRHNRITRNLIGLLWNHLRGQPCEPLAGDMLIRTVGKRYRYPDVVVICDDDAEGDAQVRDNPILIIEVLSKSTRRRDKGEKRLEYLAMPSLQEYVLIEQDFVEVEVQRRRLNWQSSVYFLGDDVNLESVELTVPVAAIYERVDNDDMREWQQQKQ